MTTVFILMIYLGRAQQESNMMFADINRCRYFASRVMKQPANPATKQKYTAICKPVEVDLKNKNVRVYRWKDIIMEDNRLKGSPFGAPPQNINVKEDLLKLFRGLIGQKSIEEQLEEQPGVGTEFKIKTPEAVQQIGDLERGLASLPRAIPKEGKLGAVVARPTKQQIADAMREEEPKKKEVKKYNLSGPDYPQKKYQSTILTPTDTSRYYNNPLELQKGIKDNNDKIMSYLYGGISKKEWAGQDPIFDFVGYSKDLNSSAFGPAQIVYSTAEPLLKNIKNKETKNFAKKMIAAQKLFKNMYDNRKTKGKYLPGKASNTPKAAGFLKDLGITRNEFLKYVEQGYFLPSNHSLSKARRKKGLVTGIPLEILGDNYKQNYFNLFKTVLKQKEKESKTKSLEDVIQRYHGANDKVKDESYQEDVFENLNLSTKQSGGMIESDPYKREPRFI